jgi:hypothetical protein
MTTVSDLLYQNAVYERSNWRLIVLKKTCCYVKANFVSQLAFRVEEIRFFLTGGGGLTSVKWDPDPVQDGPDPKPW